MLDWLRKGENFVLRIGAVASALVSILLVIGLWRSGGFTDPVSVPPEDARTLPTVTACDSATEPVAQRLVGGLAGMDCAVSQIRVCDFDSTSVEAGETSHGMPAHRMQITLEVEGERVPIIGNGRGSSAEQVAFDSLFNNLKLVLEDRDLCQ